jgi:hypothetical protein
MDRGHPDQETLGILGESVEPPDEFVMLGRQDPAVSPAHENEHFFEVVEIIEDGQDGSLHPYCLLSN